MQTFLIIWLGQFTSILGSGMTNFAITIWAWELTGQATPLSLIFVATQIPQLLISPFAGVWVDRFNRKYLMLLGDLAAGLSTIALLILLLSDHLQIWHLYISGAASGLFGRIQGLAHSASVSLLVPEKHYARASALDSIQLSSSYIVIPASAGIVYATAGLSGVFFVDLMTFGVAIATLSLVKIPQPPKPKSISDSPASDKTWKSLLFGIRYLWRSASLKVLLGFFMINSFIDSICFTNLFPMAFSRTSTDSSVLGSMFAFFGLGGLLGGVTLGIWGGPKRRIHGVLIGNAIWKAALIGLALAKSSVATFTITGLIGGFCSPFPGSCSQAIWRTRVEPGVQGRVFATRYLIVNLVGTLGAAIAGPLADYVFEPAMQSNGWLAQVFGEIFGVGTGAGIALQTALFASLGMLIALGGYRVRRLRQVEVIS
ncbi:MAG: MFS transporter [Cyanobacteria bacterium P01_D01_bin.73]